MFKTVDINKIKTNPFLLKSHWMLVTSEYDSKVNTLTASWGGFGIMWNKEVVFVFIRPERYTKEFIDKSGKFNLSFFDTKYKKDLSYLGTVSGRDEDKIAQSNLNLTTLHDYPVFEEASYAINAKVLFKQDLAETSFLDQTIITQKYPLKDFHTMYIAEIEDVFASSDKLNDLDNFLF